MALRDTTPAFIGRAPELELFTGVLDVVGAGSGAVVLVEGEAGIGKSRFAEEALREGERRGFLALRGECDEVARAQPFAPIGQAFRGREAGADMPEMPEGSGAVEAAAEYRVIEAIGALLEGLSAERPVILALEDLHWADEPTLAAFRTIGRRIADLPVLLFGTLRPAHGFPGLHRTVDELLRRGGRHLRLGPLDASATVELAAEVLGADPGPRMRERLNGAAGNPLFVIEYARSLVREGMVEVADGRAEPAGDAMPVEFTQTVLRRLAQLSSDATVLVRIGCVLGSVLPVADVAIALRRPVVEIVSAVQEAVEANVLTSRGDELSFVHALVREAVYESVAPPVRREIHREIARTFAEAGRDAAVVAHHLSLAAQPPDAEAAEWLRRAAQDLSVRAPGVAVELFERARELAPATDPARDELPADLVLPLAWSGRLAESEALARQVLDRKPRPEVAGPLRCGLVYALAWQARQREAVAYVERAPGEELRDEDELLLRAYASVARMFAFDLRGAAADAEAVANAAEAAGHELALCTALGVQSFLAAFSGDTYDAVEIGRRAVMVADRSRGGAGHLAAPRFFLGLPLIAADLLAEAEDVLRDGRRIAEELGHVWSLPLYDAYLGTVRFVAGEWDDAVALFEASLALADEIGIRMITFVAVVAWLAVVVLHRGDLERAEELLALADRRVAEAGPQAGMSLLAWARGLVHEARGRPDQGLAVLQNAWDFSVAAGLQAEPWSGAELVRMYARNGQPERAMPIAEVIGAQAERIPTPFMRARALHAKGLAASDAETVVEAVELYRQSPRPHELALACEDAAILLGRAGESARAVPLMEEAFQTYDALGATRDLSRARAALRSIGGAPRRRRGHARPAQGWESLTPTELEVARLVAQRLSNPEVAQRLFVSRHTVESHLKHIYAKLGVSSRVELARKRLAETPA